MAPVEIWQNGVLINKLVDDKNAHQSVIRGKSAQIRVFGESASLDKFDGRFCLKVGDSVAFDTHEVAVVTDK